MIDGYFKKSQLLDLAIPEGYEFLEPWLILAEHRFYQNEPKQDFKRIDDWVQSTAYRLFNKGRVGIAIDLIETHINSIQLPPYPDRTARIFNSLLTTEEIFRAIDARDQLLSVLIKMYRLIASDPNISSIIKGERCLLITRVLRRFSPDQFSFEAIKYKNRNNKSERDVNSEKIKRAIRYGNKALEHFKKARAAAYQEKKSDDILKTEKMVFDASSQLLFSQNLLIPLVDEEPQKQKIALLSVNLADKLLLGNRSRASCGNSLLT